MIAVAFKKWKPGANFVDGEIHRITGGDYVHVELAFLGNIPASRPSSIDIDQFALVLRDGVGYSSRLGSGTGFQPIDFSDISTWKLVFPDILRGLSAQDEALMHAFCLGSSGRPYDEAAIAGIALRQQVHVSGARFCSDEDFNVLQQTRGFHPEIKPWDVIPSGKMDGRVALFDLLQPATTAASK